MNAAKIQFSAEESTLLQDPRWLLTKNRVITRIYDLLGHQATALQQYRSLLPPEVCDTPPKISRGENYQELPWVMLDYPRLFSPSAVFALRSFFWWGRFWNISLHLKGAYLDYLSGWTDKRWQAFEALGGRCSCTGDEWNHDWYESAGITVQAFRNGAGKEWHDLPFLKLGVNLSLLHPEEWAEKMDAVYAVLLGGEPDQLPRR